MLAVVAATDHQLSRLIYMIIKVHVHIYINEPKIFVIPVCTYHYFVQVPGIGNCIWLS